MRLRSFKGAKRWFVEVVTVGLDVAGWGWVYGFIVTDVRGRSGGVTAEEMRFELAPGGGPVFFTRSLLTRRLFGIPPMREQHRVCRG